jgi:hypothetical protein
MGLSSRVPVVVDVVANFAIRDRNQMWENFSLSGRIIVIGVRVVVT